MADQIVISAEPRPGDGKGEARALRAEGRVPAVTYGADVENQPIHVDARELRAALSTEAGENAVIDVKVGDTSHLALPREIHRHPVRRDILHLDFVAINRNVKVTVDVPLVVEGDAPEGSIVSQPLNTLSIEVLPLEVPGNITVSISGLEIGDVIRVGEITVPDGVDLLDDPERTAVSITLPDTEPVDEAAEDELDGEVEGEAVEAEDGAEEAPAEGDAE
ncbi:50S ribosomal protein L25 [Euzebya tangerina]|uniref:50S ribosomal protein L25 n=1 Tax=Euzebya tangerina TaxID=591198 RepID=UPI000E30E234|nr:50S ribosomal protein L25 [Euzebya tangerina]